MQTNSTLLATDSFGSYTDLQSNNSLATALERIADVRASLSIASADWGKFVEREPA